MRGARIKEAGAGFYHVLSRVVDRRRALNDKEKGRFCEQMRAVERFSGVQILTHAILDNHFHILVHVPERIPIADEVLVQRLGALYDRTYVRGVAEHLAVLRRQGYHEAAERYKHPFTKRMYDLSEFMKTLKQRYTQSYNHRHGRKGTLWEERFKSILVQGAQGALSAIAAYIDLNAVRARIVSDPKDYRFCGYGEAVGGCRRARRGLGAVMHTLGQGSAWSTVCGQYRRLLYETGEARGATRTGAPVRPGFTREAVQSVLDQGGKLTMGQALHCRVRYFSDGLVLGSRVYVDDVFLRFRDRFGAKRTTGARPMCGADFGDLFTCRRLHLAVISVPSG